ncbi:MAG: ABC transporter ATP-binding protein, partial [Papillibacter sp.]|nr:ABC transporter ATP-binding protein [Papillibacter sp.]
TLNFEDNKIYGLLGRNGAGKSTLLNIITGRVFLDSGEVLVDGSPAAENDEALHKLYLANEKTLLPENMRVRDAFKWTKEFYPDFDMEYAMKAAEQFKLDTSKRVKALSTGFDSIMKDIIALSVDTPYVLLDEPVLGLDANNRDLFYRLLIEKYSQKPCTVVISTHLIEEVSTVIEEIVIIKESRIIRNESRESLLSKGYTVSGMASKVDEYIKDKNVIGSESLGGLKTAYILGEDSPVRAEGLEITSLELQKLFIHLTNS